MSKGVDTFYTYCISSLIISKISSLVNLLLIDLIKLTSTSITCPASSSPLFLGGALLLSDGLEPSVLPGWFDFSLFFCVAFQTYTGHL